MTSPPTDLFEVTAHRADSPTTANAPITTAPIAAPSARADTAVAKKISRRKLFRRLIIAATLPLASGAYGTEIEPFWPDWHDVPMPLRGLPNSFDGFRLP